MKKKLNQPVCEIIACPKPGKIVKDFWKIGVIEEVISKPNLKIKKFNGVEINKRFLPLNILGVIY